MLFDDDKKKPPREPAERDTRNRNWREMDRKKDRSGHRDGDRSSGASSSIHEHGLKGDHAERYKKQLDALFQGGKKPNPEQEQQLKKIRQARGAEIDKLCTKFVEEYGLPGDWESLLVFMDASSPSILSPVMQHLDKLRVQESSARQSTFKQRLRLLTMTTADNDLRKQAEAILTTLN